MIFISIAKLNDRCFCYVMAATFVPLGRHTNMAKTEKTYIKIYLTVRRQMDQIQAVQVQQEVQASEVANFAVLLILSWYILRISRVFDLLFALFYQFRCLKNEGSECHFGNTLSFFTNPS